MQGTLTEEEIRRNPQLQLYVQMLLEQGDRLGLTAFREAEPIWSELVADSATAATLLPENGEICDLGSGGGCPGVILQVLRPDTIIYLLESNGRKAGFLREVVSSLGLASQVLQDRSETVAHQKAYRERFDMVVAKGVATMPTLIELSLPLLKIGGQLLAFKGRQAQQEIEDSDRALQLLGGQTPRVLPYSLGPKNYCHVLVEKIAKGHKEFPRRPGIPAKQPLKAKEA